MSMYREADLGLKLAAALRKWKAEANCWVVRCRRPRLYSTRHSRGSRYVARFRQLIDWRKEKVGGDRGGVKVGQRVGVRQS